MFKRFWLWLRQESSEGKEGIILGLISGIVLGALGDLLSFTETSPAVGLVSVLCVTILFVVPAWSSLMEDGLVISLLFFVPVAIFGLIIIFQSFGFFPSAALIIGLIGFCQSSPLRLAYAKIKFPKEG